MIKRLESSVGRIFPPIRPDLYKLHSNLSELTPCQKVAYKLLILANRDFTLWERLTGWRLNAQGQVGRLLLQHRLAMEAELEGRWNSADFYWKQAQIEIKALAKREDLWQILVKELAVDEPEVVVTINSLMISQRLVYELLIDTHYAFYNGLIRQKEKLSLSDRAFVHIDYIEQLINLAGVSGRGLPAFLEQAWQTRITLCKEAKKWQQALQVCQKRLRFRPNKLDFQNELAEIHWLSTLAKLREGKPQANHQRIARTVQTGIGGVEKCLEQYPYNLSIFEFLGSLYHLQAISLANSEQFAQALVSIQKAVTYNPYSEKAFETRNELVQVMAQLQEQVKQVQIEIAQSFNAQLNQKGQKLLAQALKGFAPLNAYLESEEAKITANNFQVAQAVHLWQTIGLPEPEAGWQVESPAGMMQTADGKTVPIESTTSWSKKALQLWEGVESIFKQAPPNQADLAAVWESVVAHKPDLAQLDSTLISAFLERKLFGEGSERILVTPPVASAGEPPMLTPVSLKRQPGTEPFLPWLFSPQDKRIKLQAAVASVLVLVAGGLGIQDRLRNSARETAYQQIQAAEQIQDDLGVVKGAEVFFANSPLSGKDGRNEQVMEHYTESLVRWFAQQENPPDADGQKHLERYRQVTNTLKPQNQP